MDYSSASLETCVALAQAHDTRLEILEQLAQHKDETVRRAIALNPNASEALLEQLREAFPEEIIQNPIFGILLLENPDNPLVRRSLARSITTPPEKLIQYAKSTDEATLIAVCRNPNAPASVLEDLADSHSSSQSRRYRKKKKDDLILTAIAQNENTPAPVLLRLAEHCPETLCAIAQNPKAPADTLTGLSISEDEQLLLLLAKNPSLTSTAVANLITASRESVRTLAQGHPNQPDNADELNDFIQRKRNTSTALLDTLAQDPRRHIRYWVVEHPNTSEAGLKAIAKDEKDTAFFDIVNDPKSSGIALEETANALHKNHHIDRTVRLAILTLLTKHPNVTESALKMLSVGGYDSISRQLGNSSQTPTSVLLEMSRHSKEMYALAKNPSTPAAALKNIFNKMCETYNPVKEANESMFLSVTMNGSNLRKDALECLKDIARHANVPPSILPALLTDPKTRAAVSENPTLPASLINRLMKTHNISKASNGSNESDPPFEFTLNIGR